MLGHRDKKEADRENYRKRMKAKKSDYDLSPGRLNVETQEILIRLHLSGIKNVDMRNYIIESELPIDPPSYYAIRRFITVYKNDPDSFKVLAKPDILKIGISCT